MDRTRFERFGQALAIAHVMLILFVDNAANTANSQGRVRGVHVSDQAQQSDTSTPIHRSPPTTEALRDFCFRKTKVKFRLF